MDVVDARSRNGTSMSNQKPARGIRLSRSSTISVLLVVLALCIGTGIGLVGMRRRYNARNVAVAVNGVTITEDDILREMQVVGGAKTLRQLVDDELVLQYAKRGGFLPTDAEVEDAYTKAKRQPQFKRTLEGTWQTTEDYKHNLRVTLARAALATRGISVSDAEVRRFYAANIDPKNRNARYYTPEAATISVIVTRSQEQAQQAMEDYQHHGMAWPMVVQKYSQDHSKVNAGLLPPILRGRAKSAQVPGLEPAIFGMKVGDLTGPKQYAGAWWIIRCLDKQPAKVRAFEDVKEDCRIGAKLVKSSVASQRDIAKELQDFESQAKVEALWSRYRDAVKISQAAPRRLAN